MKTGNRILTLATLALVTYGCADQPQPSMTGVEVLEGTSAASAGTISSLQDGNNDGNAAFLWLQPVSDGIAPAPLLTGLSPEVEICNKDGVCTRTTADEESDHYHADLKSGVDGKPIKGSPYEIRVYGFGDFLLGSFDVALTNNGNIPLKFWIGDGFDAEAAEECLDADRCNLGGIVGDEGGTVVVASPVGGTGAIAAAVFPEGWSPGGIDRTVTIDCRDDFPSELADDGSGPLNTGLTQLPWYCDFSVDPALAPGEMFLEDVIVEVCETVDMDHATVVLGKTSSAGDDFELLPFVEPQNLGDCFADYPGGDLGEIASTDSFWGGISRRLASVFEVIGPEPLRANMLRDGGAGGSVRGFSFINPVIPAEIEVEVADDQGGLEVSLFQGGSVVATEETDELGHAHFNTLLEGDYTVTITGETEVEYEGGSSQDVAVVGSGPFEVEFVPIEEDVPTILSAAPVNGGTGQMVTFFVDNLVPSPGDNPNVTVTFDVGGTTGNGFVFLSPSSSTQLYVRIPSAPFPTGPADVTVTDNNNAGLESPVFAFDLNTVPGTPEIVSTPSTVIPGANLLVQTYGIDTSRGEACFTQGSTPSSGPTCSGAITPQTSASTSNNSLRPHFTVPGLSEGDVWLQVRQGCHPSGCQFSFVSAESLWSEPVLLEAQIPG